MSLVVFIENFLFLPVRANYFELQILSDVLNIIFIFCHFHFVNQVLFLTLELDWFAGFVLTSIETNLFK